MQSKLLSHLFTAPRSSEVLTVLDVGSAMPDTVEFFSEYRCRLYFLDLFSESFLQHQSEMEEEELRRAMIGALTIPKGTRLDVCLLWDFPNYLDKRTLALFFELITPYLHPSTRAHCFGTLNGKTASTDRQYGLESTESLSVRGRRETAASACYPHSQSEIRDLAPQLEINRGVLLSDGRLEMLLTVKTEADSEAVAKMASLRDSPVRVRLREQAVSG